MANEVMAKALSGIDDELIVNAYKASTKKRNLKPLYSISAIAACLVLIFTLILSTSGNTTAVFLNNEKVTSSPQIVTSPLSTASVSPRAISNTLTLPLEINLSSQTSIKCSQGTIAVYEKDTDALIYSGNTYTAKTDVSLLWTVNDPDEAKVYTLTLEGKKAQVLKLKFDENENNWTIFIEK